MLDAGDGRSRPTRREWLLALGFYLLAAVVIWSLALSGRRVLAEISGLLMIVVVGVQAVYARPLARVFHSAERTVLRTFARTEREYFIVFRFGAVLAIVFAGWAVARLAASLMYDVPYCLFTCSQLPS